MGTNYYIVCKCCGSHMKHIGKSSIGWPFISNYENVEAIFYDLNEMNRGVDKYEIRDEYNYPFSPVDFKKFIDERYFNSVQMGWLKVDGEFS